MSKRLENLLEELAVVAGLAELNGRNEEAKRVDQERDWLIQKLLAK